MKRLLALIIAAGVVSAANWEGAEWHAVYTADTLLIEGLIGLSCRGDTNYLFPYGEGNRAELVRWSPDDATQTIELPFDLIAVNGINHGDSLKRHPGVLQGPTLWRLTDNGWDSLRVGSNTWWPSCFAVGPNGALHYLLNDSLSEGVIYRRQDGTQAEVDTTISPCIQQRYVGHWVGVDLENNATCVIEENFQSGEDLWIPCVRAVRFTGESVQSTDIAWRTWNRRYLQGFDGRWLIVRDLCVDGLVAEILEGLTLQASASILRYDDKFRSAQNPVDSLFEVAGMYASGEYNIEIVREQPNSGSWQDMRTFDTPASVRSFHFMIDQSGFGHLFVADSNTIYRFGPPPRFSDVQSRAPLPQEITLSVYPNPGNAEFRLSYSLDRNSNVSLKLYDVTGREVAMLVNSTRNAGEHVVNWSATAQPSGVYFAVLNAGDARQVKKLVLMK